MGPYQTMKVSFVRCFNGDYVVFLTNFFDHKVIVSITCVYIVSCMLCFIVGKFLRKFNENQYGMKFQLENIKNVNN